MSQHPHHLAKTARLHQERVALATRAPQAKHPPEPPDAVPSAGELFSGLVIAAGLVVCAVATPLLIVLLALWKLL